MVGWALTPPKSGVYLDSRQPAYRASAEDFAQRILRKRQALHLAAAVIQHAGAREVAPFELMGRDEGFRGPLFVSRIQPEVGRVQDAVGVPEHEFAHFPAIFARQETDP